MNDKTKLVLLRAGCLSTLVTSTSTVAVAAATAVTTTAATTTTTESMSMPHIVFIMVDDMGYNDFGQNSTDLAAATQFMTSLVEKGVKLSRYYTQQSCTPARASFLAGRYPAMVGMGYDSRVRRHGTRLQVHGDLPNLTLVSLRELSRQRGHTVSLYHKNFSRNT